MQYHAQKIALSRSPKKISTWSQREGLYPEKADLWYFRFSDSFQGLGSEMPHWAGVAGSPKALKPGAQKLGA